MTLLLLSLLTTCFTSFLLFFMKPRPNSTSAVNSKKNMKRTHLLSSTHPNSSLPYYTPGRSYLNDTGVVADSAFAVSSANP